MYIGPWQEYNLSKKAASNNRVNAQLRPSIEQALLSTLDPEAAKKAIEAMTPYFEKQASTGMPTHNSLIPAHGRPRDQRQRAARAYPTLDSGRNRSMVAAGERLLHTSSPLSVRSTQSEPIRYSSAMSSASIQQPATPKLAEAPAVSHYGAYATNIPVLNAAAPHTQPAYNASAMLNLLRLERNTQARSQIAKLTGWKVDSAALSDNGTTERKSKAASEQRLEQVNMMKQMYLSGGPNATAGTPTSNTMKLTSDNLARLNQETTHSNKVSGNNLSTYQGDKPAAMVMPEVSLKTPRINDMDLTDEAFNLISKYFQSSEESGGGLNSNASLHSHLGAGDAQQQNSVGMHKVPLSRSLLSVLRGRETDTPINDDMASETASVGSHTRDIDKNYVNDINTTATRANNGAGNMRCSQAVGAGRSVPPTPGHEGDDLYAGGMDSLLLWSSQLELDIS